MLLIETAEDIQRELGSLIQRDPRLEPLLAAVGEVPLRRRSADFEGLSNIVVAQLLSVQAAASIWSRVVTLVQPFEPQVLLSVDEEALRAAGLSWAKIRTLRAIAQEVDGGLDLHALALQAGDEAHARLCQIKGIGRWTADIYLLFCAGHPDVFPSGDKALQNVVQSVLALEACPQPVHLDDIARAWAPHRGTAARLLWAYYAVMKNGKETLPV
ncbi:DNA-3-methyladenine glycosylase 2 family protein [Rhodobacteraceae bacterium RKSG542]|uniref:DNA-3-methyladenine glycosylase family protein n=1 Tax=Pseudovibrio flavus TaxID=2529854 RepID=UPI0012BBBB0F|nr:DNA-3-methyladenine glycosylase [Pseudovibrio flavus]MTI18382.1 DNA-3-methyladenine glycosylase 2 family protein [Pseudovibrio flavus]